MIAMPAILVSTVNFGKIYLDSGKEYDGYCIDLQELKEHFPHIDKGKRVGVYLIEVRNDQGKLVKRFKPFERLDLETTECLLKDYGGSWKMHIVLPLSEDVVTKFNIGMSYKVAIALVEYDGKPFLPLEIRPVGYEAQKIVEYFQAIEADLLTLYFENPDLNEACSYLWDAWLRLEENDIEGARTAIRNSLQILMDKLLPNIYVPEESEDFLNRLEKLIKSIRDLLHYGGPHPGPSPRSSTELAISLAIDLLKYFSKGIEKKVILFKKR